MKTICDKGPPRIRVLTGKSKNLHKKVIDLKSVRIILKASLTENVSQVKCLQSEESNLKKSMIVVKARLLLKDHELHR